MASKVDGFGTNDILNGLGKATDLALNGFGTNDERPRKLSTDLVILNDILNGLGRRRIWLVTIF